MEKVKVVEINDGLVFDNGMRLESEHKQSCCEWHELSFRDLDLEDFNGLEFDLSNDHFFKRIPDYGIELIPIKGHSVKIPGHGSNNGYYSDNIDLVLYHKNGKKYKSYDVTECQVINN